MLNLFLCLIKLSAINVCGVTEFYPHSLTSGLEGHERSTLRLGRLISRKESLCQLNGSMCELQGKSGIFEEENRHSINCCKAPLGHLHVTTVAVEKQ